MVGCGAVPPSWALAFTANPSASAANASTSIVQRASILCDLFEDSGSIEAPFRLMQLACGPVPSRAQRAPKDGRLRRGFCRLQYHTSFSSYISVGASSPPGLEESQSGSGQIRRPKSRAARGGMLWTRLVAEAQMQAGRARLEERSWRSAAGGAQLEEG